MLPVYIHYIGPVVFISYSMQVLPYLLKQLAEFVVQLPTQGQNVLLDEMYAQVAESDDVARKPVLVSWLQSLSYLCSQKKTNCVKDGDARLDAAAASLSASSGSLELSRTSARLWEHVLMLETNVCRFHNVCCPVIVITVATRRCSV